VTGQSTCPYGGCWTLFHTGVAPTTRRSKPAPTRHDLTSDPGELHDLAPEPPQEAMHLNDHLSRLRGPDGDAVPSAGAVPAASGPDEPDAELRRALKSLGYLQ